MTRRKYNSLIRGILKQKVKPHLRQIIREFLSEETTRTEKEGLVKALLDVLRQVAQESLNEIGGEILDELHREIRQEGLDEPAENLEVSVRALSTFKNAGIKTIGDLIQRSENEILNIRNCGKRTVKEIKEVLADRGLSLKERPSR